MQLLPHQHATVEHLGNHIDFGARQLIPLPPRMGKTVSTVTAAAQYGIEHILVLAPLTSLDTWQKEIPKWDGRNLPIRTFHAAGGDPVPPHTHGWWLCNYDSLRKGYKVGAKNDKDNRGGWKVFPRGNFPTGWQLIIVDESILVKSRGSQISAIVRKLVLENPHAIVWMLSGNPASRWLDDLYMQLSILDKRIYHRGYWRFAQEYCEVVEDIWGKHIIGDQPDGAARLLRDFSYLYWTPPDLPPLNELRIRTINVELGPEQRRMYIEMEEEFLARLSEVEDDVVLAPNVLAQAVRLSQILSNPALIGGESQATKWREAFHQLDMLPKPIVMWCQFKETVRRFSEHAGQFYRLGTLTGDSSREDRNRTVQDFQDGCIDVLLAHPAVGRFSLNLSNANSVIVLERSWNADHMYQAEFRVRHLQRTMPVQQLELLATVKKRGEQAATFDHAIYSILQSRHDRSRAITAGDIRRGFQQGLEI